MSIVVAQRPTAGSDAESAWIVSPNGTVQVNLTRSATGWAVDIHDPTNRTEITLNHRRVEP